jgi:hypothetical protein
VGVYAYTYGVGFSVVVWNERQYQSLDERNSNSADPRFFVKQIVNNQQIRK